MDVIELDQILRFAFSLILVLCLMGILALILKKINAGSSHIKTKERRLSIIETLHISPKTKLFLVACDHKNYLICSGPHGDTVVDPSIYPPHSFTSGDDELKTKIETSGESTQTASSSSPTGLRAPKKNAL